MLTKFVKWYDPRISKRLKLLKLLKYLERMFPLETCTYFSSIEIKVVTMIQKSLSIEEENSDRMLGKRNFNNPIAQLESNMKLEKYDQLRKQRTAKVWWHDKKLERSEFNMKRSANYTAIELQYFERCKEEKLSKERGSESLGQLISTETPLDTELLKNKGFFVDFLGYVIAMQIRQSTRN